MQDGAKKKKLADEADLGQTHKMEEDETPTLPATHPNVTVGSLSSASSVSAKVRFPAVPSSQDPSDWKFHLHLIKGMSTNSGGVIKASIQEAVKRLGGEEGEKVRSLKEGPKRRCRRPTMTLTLPPSPRC